LFHQVEAVIFRRSVSLRFKELKLWVSNCRLPTERTPEDDKMGIMGEGLGLKFYRLSGPEKRHSTRLVL